ncbi:hypothetical protein VNI00_002509 [Paramarasmius palmivorus]|uniref:Uncharacterized protein n=1 Tax=Paramarasmius palmivorus TaxID=297713 RepID=A0AAW0DXZ3_9AGAR
MASIANTFQPVTEMGQKCHPEKARTLNAELQRLTEDIDALKEGLDILERNLQALDTRLASLSDDMDLLEENLNKSLEARYQTNEHALQGVGTLDLNHWGKLASRKKSRLPNTH